MAHWLIVGGGTAGCVLASRLSENPRDHVTLIEAGPDRAGGRATSYLDDLAIPRALWERLVVTDGGGEPRPYPQGRGLGGSSAVGGGVLSGTESGGEAPLVPRHSVATDELGLVDRALLGAAPDAVPVTLASTSTAGSHLLPARERPNLELLTDTVVARIELRNRQAVGVVTATGERIAGDRIVCAAGAIHTPALLLRSGVDTPGVGDGLADHPGRVIELLLAAPPAVATDPHGLVTGATLRRGPIEIVVMNHLGPDAPGRAALLAGVLDAERRGSVRLDPDRGDDPASEPLVDFGALSGADVARLAEAVGLARDLTATAPFRAVVDDIALTDGLGGYAHATSTCAIGTVAEEDGAVRGYQGLFVADSSALPTSPPSGTLAPVIALAERLAGRWRSLDHSSP